MKEMSKLTAYLIFAFSIVIEIIADSMLEACHGYANLPLGIAAICVILFSFFCFSKVLHIINLPVAYATWSALGALVCTIIGIFFFSQDLSLVGWISLICLMGGVVVLNIWGTPAEDQDASENDSAHPDKATASEGSVESGRKSNM